MTKAKLSAEGHVWVTYGNRENGGAQFAAAAAAAGLAVEERRLEEFVPAELLQSRAASALRRVKVFHLQHAGVAVEDGTRLREEKERTGRRWGDVTSVSKPIRRINRYLIEQFDYFSTLVADYEYAERLCFNRTRDFEDTRDRCEGLFKVHGDFTAECDNFQEPVDPRRSEESSVEEYDLKKGLVNPRNPKILDRTVKQSRPATEGDNGRPTGGTQLGPEPEELWLTDP
eukprot:g21741.t1